MNDYELTENVRRCPCMYPKDNITGRFYQTPRLEFTWKEDAKQYLCSRKGY